MPTNREVFQNDAETTLSGSVLAGDTSITVADGTEFPATGNFRLLCEGEIMHCIARSGNVLTVNRGVEGTGAANHSSGVTITHVITADSLLRMGQDNDALWGSSRPPLAKLVNGTTILVAGDFTSIGSGATFSNHNGTIQARKPNGSTLSGLVRSAPGTPYSVVAAFRAIVPGDDLGASAFFGLGFRQSSDGKAFFVALNTATSGKSFQWFTGRYNGDDTFAESVFPGPLMMMGAEVFLKVEDNGTNLKFYMGDGIDWILLRSESRTAFMASGPDQIGWFVKNTSNTPDVLVRLVHWSTE